MAAALTSRLPPEWVTWEPETLKEELSTAFNRSEVSSLNWEKIQAVRTIILSQAPWESWAAFAVILQPINNLVTDFVVMQHPTPSQCAFTVVVLKSLGGHGFSDEVQSYIASAFLNDGITYTPSPVDFVQEKTLEPRHRCLDCNWTGEGHFVSRCWSCKSERLHFFTKRDITSIQDRYEQVINQIETQDGDHDILSDESIEDTQTAKLLVVRDYLLHRNKLLVEQVRRLNVSAIPSAPYRRG